MILSGDAGLGVFDTLQKEHPDRFLNCGIAEQHMASFGAGLAMTGVKVVLYNIIPFLLYRCYEQVRNDICDQNLPVVLAGIGSGVTFAPAGISHYAVEDIALARTLPNLTVISPADPVEARAAARYALAADTPVYVRMARSGEREMGPDHDIDITAPRVIRKGTDVAIVFHGSIGDEVMAARDLLAEVGISPRVISVPMLQPLPYRQLCEALQDVQAVLSVEEHFSDSGLGATVQSLRALESPSWSLRILGIPRDGALSLVGDRNTLREAFSISARHIRDEVAALFQGGSHGM